MWIYIILQVPHTSCRLKGDFTAYVVFKCTMVFSSKLNSSSFSKLLLSSALVKLEGLTKTEQEFYLMENNFDTCLIITQMLPAGVSSCSSTRRITASVTQLSDLEEFSNTVNVFVSVLEFLSQANWKWVSSFVPWTNCCLYSLQQSNSTGNSLCTNKGSIELSGFTHLHIYKCLLHTVL